MNAQDGQNGRAPTAPEQLATDTDFSPPRGNPFPVVGIGASAGGLEAFTQLLAALPADTGMAFVLVQHLDPMHESLLPELLAPHTTMPVTVVEDELAIKPDHVYVIPPNKSMELAEGVLRLAAREPGLHLPIDIFFRSLAVAQGSKSVGVVLSGNASDGSLGVRAIKAECGLTFAQDEATARFGAMPRNAAATGAIDYVLPPAAIARELAAIAQHPFLVPRQPGNARTETLPDGDQELRRIFGILRTTTKVDFSRYKPTTIRRRIGRRMMVLRVETLGEYLQTIEEDPAELRELYRDLLISVTSFFRDPESFEALRKLMSSQILGRTQKEEPLRVWVPGCATGEEVYSLAILLFEILQEHHLSTPLQLFGTDISDLALDRARQGIYPPVIEEDISPERLRRFFTKVDSGYQISKAIRENCVFARHDVTADPPFSSLDLVSCRNLLIYLDQGAQRHILPVFHFALKPTGLLLLGSAESTAAAPELFTTVDQAHKIYGRAATVSRLPLEMNRIGRQIDPMLLNNQGAAPATLDLQKRVERVIQNKYSPDAVLVNAEFQILQLRGHTSLYLDPSPGQASLNVLRMATEGLVVPLRRCVKAAAEAHAPVRESGLEVTLAEKPHKVTLEVTPISGADPGERYFLIVFLREQFPQVPGEEESRTSLLPVDEQVAFLQRELNETRSYLRNMTEQYEAHSEELRAANEEARSSNEELQSTNEELRTTKEELQSTNEELTTVNEELQGRNRELNSTNSDFKNLLSSISVPILMLDSELRVRRFNTAAGVLLDLGPIDIGRPVGHIRGPFETPHLERHVKRVIERLDAYSEELQDANGRWYALAIRPYRTVDDRITGAVITLQDIDPLKRGLEAAEDARDYAEAMIETVREPLVVLDADLRVQRATQAFYDVFQVSRDETQGRLLYDLGSGQWNHPRLRELIGAALFRSEPFHDFELRHEFPNVGDRVVRLNGRRIPFPDSARRMLLLSIVDVTERREVAEIRYQRLFETAKDGIVVVDMDSQTIQDVNAQFLEQTGYSREDLSGKPIADAGEKLGLAQVQSAIEATKLEEVVRYEDAELKRQDGSTIHVDVIANSYTVGTQPVVQFNVRDVSVRNQALKDLRASEQRFRLFVDSVGDFALFQADPDGRIMSWNSGAERLLGWSEREAIGQPTSLIFTPEDIARHEPEHEIETARRTGRSADERWHVRKDGGRFFASGVLTKVCDEQERLVGFAKVMRDITSRRNQEQQLRRTVSEKDTLVREIHHRVKNNLQVIVSLLSMQSRYTTDVQVLTAFQEAESRLRAIAHIHERLYASDDLSQIEFAGYVTGLANELVQLYSEDPEQIELQLDVEDVVLHIERAIPLGLIANELIQNCIKHGLRGGKGRLDLRLSKIPNQMPSGSDDELWGELLVGDTGTGLPPGLDLGRARSMGLRLVTMLIRQLHGELEVRPGPGAVLAVKFPLQQLTYVSEAAEDEAKSFDR